MTVMTMINATEELRRLLDERGVEWSDYSDDRVFHTSWNNMSCWFNEFTDGWTAWGMSMHGTPEQAIAATLGSGTCSMEYGDAVTEDTKRVLDVYFCSECGSPTYNDCMPYYCIYCGKAVKRG